MTDFPSLNSRGRIAVQIMLELARSEGELVPLHSIATKIGVSNSYLEKIAATLRTNGLIQAQRRQSGGYRLNRPPQEITIAQIVDAANEFVNPTANPKPPENPGDPSALLWDHITKSALMQLSKITLADTLKTDF
jgi:Rrf2 family iron-sulfur cluster assembly transcriptional regulator